MLPAELFNVTPKRMYVAIFSPSGNLAEAQIFGPYTEPYKAAEVARRLDYIDPSEPRNGAFNGVFEIQNPAVQHGA